MAGSLISKGIDAIKDVMLANKFEVGATYEMYKPVATQYIEQMGVSFALPDYSFVISGFGGGMVWTKDITYVKHSPPPPHPVLGSPLAPQVLEFIRPVTS